MYICYWENCTITVLLFFGVALLFAYCFAFVCACLFVDQVPKNYSLFGLLKARFGSCKWGCAAGVQIGSKGGEIIT